MTFVLSMTQAQIVPGFVGSKGNFLDTPFCLVSHTCFPAGTVRLANGDMEEYFNVKPKAKQEYGQNLYTVFFTRLATNRQIERAGLRYLPAQDDTEDGSFALDFFSFASGVPLQALGRDGLVTRCRMAIRGSGTTYFFDSDLRFPLSNAGEEIFVLYNGYWFGESWFDQKPPTTRVVKTTNC